MQKGTGQRALLTLVGMKEQREKEQRELYHKRQLAAIAENDKPIVREPMPEIGELDEPTNNNVVIPLVEQPAPEPEQEKEEPRGRPWTSEEAARAAARVNRGKSKFYSYG